jgi:hypothetical protein
MIERARRGTKPVVVEMELEKYNGHGETGVFSTLKTSLALPRQSMPMYVEVRWGWGKKASTVLVAKERGCT